MWAVRVCGGEQYACEGVRGEVCDYEDFSPEDPLPLLTGEPR